MSLPLHRQEILRLTIKSSSAETGEGSGTSDKNYKSFLRRIPKPRRALMAVVIDSCAWGDHFAKECNHITTQLLAGTTSRYPHLHPHLTAEHICHLLRHYFTWHSRVMREEPYRRSGESISMMDILEWGGVR